MSKIIDLLPLVLRECVSEIIPSVCENTCRSLHKTYMRCVILESIQEMFQRKNKSKYNTEEEEFDNIPAPTIAGDPNSKKNAQKKKKKPYMFPYWCNYIAWICKGFINVFVIGTSFTDDLYAKIFRWSLSLRHTEHENTYSNSTTHITY